MHDQERRSAARRPLSSQGYIVFNGIDLDLETHDISCSGVLIRLDSRHGIGTGTTLRIHLDIGHVGSAVVCRTANNGEATLLALKFEEPLPAAILH